MRSSRVPASLVAALLLVGGCDALFGVKALDYDGADASLDGPSGKDGEPPSDRTLPGDSGAPRDGQSEADVPAADSAPGFDANDSGDAPSCVDRCSAGATQCTGKLAQACKASAAGCLDWVTTQTCGTNQTCANDPDAGATCACNGTVCPGTGFACQNGALGTCAKDTDGCFHVASTMPCPSPTTCSGMAPNAMCSSTCSDQCTQGQKECIQGALATCEAGDAGCLVYGPPVMCPTNQSCTGAPGSASCTCTAPSGCSTAGNTCSGSSYVTCGTDSNQCLYVVGTVPCSNGTCYGGAGSAQCCTNACTAGSTCNGNTPVTCGAGANGCLQQTTGTPCGGSTPVCSGGGCVAAGCDGGAGQCASGSCCNSGGSCVAAGDTTCPQSGTGQCQDCTTDGFGPKCVGGTHCGCSSAGDCSGANSTGYVCLSNGMCGCNSSSDCPGGGCCEPQNYCVAARSLNNAGGTVCDGNGNWVAKGALGSPCDIAGMEGCNSPYCCDFVSGLTCISSAQACSNGVCGMQGWACCNGACVSGLTCNGSTCN